MQGVIINRGRGPEIAGSRITVYDVLAETQAGASPQQLADWYGLEEWKIQAALRYIEDHKDEVHENYRKIKQRHARGNPPQLQAKLAASHEKFQEALAKKKKVRPEDNHDGHSRRH